MNSDLELAACTPTLIQEADFNAHAVIPYGCTLEHVYAAMNEFIGFLGYLNRQLYEKNLPRMESLLMPANFSSLVGEFMHTVLPKHCRTLVKNQYHNGHPDLIPAGTFPHDAVQHSEQGIEIKASRYRKGWQGHNPEHIWLLVFVFDSNRPGDPLKNISPRPFRFLEVLGAQLEKQDWLFAGRSSTSRRTITASVTQSGYNKMSQNWIYRDSSLFEQER
ncbi:MAG: hypothetical protein K8I60_07875 [Anaerolineae bacterium]|nr:hypothetical protein [Anaerolineae bacterium]